MLFVKAFKGFLSFFKPVLTRCLIILFKEFVKEFLYCFKAVFKGFLSLCYGCLKVFLSYFC